MGDGVPGVGPHRAHRARRLLLLAVHEVVEHQRTVVDEQFAQPHRPGGGGELVVIGDRAGREVAAGGGDTFTGEHQVEFGRT